MKDLRSRYVVNAKVFALLFICFLTAIVVIQVVFGQNTSNNWTTYQHDNRRSGLSPLIGPQTNQANELYDFGTLPGMSVYATATSVVVGPTGLIYVTKYLTNFGGWKLIALHPDGSIAFESLEFPGQAAVTPTIADDGTVYVPVGADLYALFPNGSLKWSKSFATGLAPVALAADGTIYVSSGLWQPGADVLKALNPDGTEKWTYDYGGVQVLQSPAVAPNGNVMVTDGGGRWVAAHDSTNGNQLWLTFLGADPGTLSSPSVAPDGTVYAFYNRLWALSPAGQIKWVTPFIDPVLGSTPSVAGDGSVLFATSNYNPAGVAQLFSYAPSGQMQWVANLTQSLGFSNPQIALDVEGTAYVTFASNGCTTPCPSLPFIFSVGSAGNVRWSYSATFAKEIIISGLNTAYVPVFTSCSDCGFTGSWKIFAFVGVSTPTPTPTPSPSPIPFPSPSPAVFSWGYPLTPYVPGSYSNRGFFCCANTRNGRHLGEDEQEHEGTPVHAIGPGIVRFYGPAAGYGDLVAAVEHDLGRSYDFVNGYGQTVRTRYILSIYGHIRDSQVRSGARTGLQVNTEVDKNTVIGFVNNSSHPDGLKRDPNGDGLEHLHMGIRLSDAITARRVDGKFWLRGYEGGTDRGKDFAAASMVISILIQMQ